MEGYNIQLSDYRNYHITPRIVDIKDDRIKNIEIISFEYMGSPEEGVEAFHVLTKVATSEIMNVELLNDDCKKLKLPLGSSTIADLRCESYLKFDLMIPNEYSIQKPQPQLLDAEVINASASAIVANYIVGDVKLYATQYEKRMAL